MSFGDPAHRAWQLDEDAGEPMACLGMPAEDAGTPKPCLDAPIEDAGPDAEPGPCLSFARAAEDDDGEGQA